MGKKSTVRAYVGAGGFTISLGPLNLIGRLIPVLATGSQDYADFCVVCPECPEPVRPRQGYTCENGHGPYPLADLDRARDTDDGLVRVTKEEYEAARHSDLPLNHCRVSVHPAEQVDTLTRPSGQGYVFIPDVDSREHDLVLALSMADQALVAAVNVRHFEGLYRLQSWNGNLVLQRLLWPKELNEFAPREIDVDAAHLDAGLTMLDRLSDDFEPEDYVATTRQKLEALNAALEGTEIESTPRTERRDDLLDVLSSFG